MHHILAIDPGSTRSGIALLHRDGRISTEKLINEGVLIMLAQDLADTVVAIEKPLVYMGGHEITDTCIWAGRFYQQASRRCLELRWVSRQDVLRRFDFTRKKGGPTADSFVKQRLTTHYGPTRAEAVGTKKNPGPLFGIKADAWQALAIALTVKGEVLR